MIQNAIGLLLDFGLLVLIWMVQLIVYPSFLFFETRNLLIWHNKYTRLIALLVIPLMFGQLGFSIYKVYMLFNLASLLNLLLVCFVWIMTFSYFAPTHSKISQGIHSKATLEKLVKVNTWRTLAWTLVFIISLYTYLFNSF